MRESARGDTSLTSALAKDTSENRNEIKHAIKSAWLTMKNTDRMRLQAAASDSTSNKKQQYIVHDDGERQFQRRYPFDGARKRGKFHRPGRPRRAQRAEIIRRYDKIGRDAILAVRPERRGGL